MSLRSALIIATCVLTFTTALVCLDGEAAASMRKNKCCSHVKQCFSFEADGSNVDILLKMHMDKMIKAATRNCDSYDICKKLGLEAGGSKSLNIFELQKTGITKDIKPFPGITEKDLSTNVGSASEIALKEKDEKLVEKKLAIALYQKLRFHYNCCNTDLCNTFTFKS